MTITYFGHSSFKLKGKNGTVVTDPYDPYIGFSMPTVSADLVTVSHDHKDHANVGAINGTARRDNPFIVTKAGEYEVGGISVFGVESFHDASKGAERGGNIIFTVLLDGLRICHLGDLGHELSAEQLERIGAVDVLLCPVGGVYTIAPETAVKAIRSLEPSIVIPMHYKTDRHTQDVFGEMSTLEDFLKEYGVEVTPQLKLDLEKGSLPEETEVMALRPE